MLAALPDGPDGVNDPASWQAEAGCRLGVTSLAAAKFRARCGKLLRTSGRVDGPIDAATHRQGAVGRVHYGVHCQFRDVALEGDNGRMRHPLSVPANADGNASGSIAWSASTSPQRAGR